MAAITKASIAKNEMLAEKIKEFHNRLPFILTSAQKRVVEEINGKSK